MRLRCFNSMRSVAIFTSLLVGGCKVGPDFAAPQSTIPGSWGEISLSDETAAETPNLPSTPTADAISMVEWWMVFNDETLNSLIVRGVEANLDVRLAVARVREARAQRGIISADLYPSVDAAASASRSRNSENGFGGFSGGPGVESSLYEAGFDASWEIDVFGGTRRGVEAADADIAATVEDYHSVLVTLASEIAQSYMDLRGAQRQLEIAQANLKVQSDTLDITRSRYEAGMVSDLDVARSRAQVETTRSQLPGFETEMRQSIHALSVLLAQPPMTLMAELSPQAPVPVPPSEVPVGLPSDLLRRRPDIRRAERQIAAATARVGVATADLFPRFSLTGTFGVQSSQIDTLMNSNSTFWSIGPAVRWPILDWGRIRSNIEVQNAREEQAWLFYEQVVLGSLQEVEDSLVAFTHEQVRRESLLQAVTANRRAVSLAQQLYRQGLSDFLSVLEAQRDLFVTESALVQSDVNVVRNLVRLYKALGGGWERTAGVEDAQVTG